MDPPSPQDETEVRTNHSIRDSENPSTSNVEKKEHNFDINTEPDFDINEDDIYQSPVYGKSPKIPKELVDELEGRLSEEILKDRRLNEEILKNRRLNEEILNRTLSNNQMTKRSESRNSAVSSEKLLMPEKQFDTMSPSDRSSKTFFNKPCIFFLKNPLKSSIFSKRIFSFLVNSESLI